MKFGVFPMVRRQILKTLKVLLPHTKAMSSLLALSARQERRVSTHTDQAPSPGTSDDFIKKLTSVFRAEWSCRLNLRACGCGDCEDNGAPERAQASRGVTDKPYEVKKHVAALNFGDWMEAPPGMKPPKFSGHLCTGDCLDTSAPRNDKTKDAHVFWPSRLVGQACPRSRHTHKPSNLSVAEWTLM